MPHPASIIKLIFPGTKWPPFRRCHSQMHFHELKVVYFDSNFIEVCSQWSNWQYVSIGSGSGMVPSRPQAITWSNTDPVPWRIYAVLGRDELNRRKGLLAYTNNNYCIKLPKQHEGEMFILRKQFQFTSNKIWVWSNLGVLLVYIQGDWRHSD